MVKWISRIIFGFAAVIATGLTNAQAASLRSTVHHSMAPKFKKLSSLVLNTTRGGDFCNNTQNCYKACTQYPDNGGQYQHYLILSQEYFICGFNFFGNCTNSNNVICTRHDYSYACQSPFNVTTDPPIPDC